MNTYDIMQLSKEMAGFCSVKGESSIFFQANVVNNVLVGIDINNDDLLFAKKEGFDLVISHHPPNKIFTLRFCEEISEMIGFLIQNGVSNENAQLAIQPIYNKYYEWNKSNNHSQTELFANKIKMPLMNIHQPCDELGRCYMQKIINETNPHEKIQTLIQRFKEIPEINNGSEQIELVCGHIDNQIGKAIMWLGFGTNGGFTGAKALFDTGFDTVVYIHMHPFQKDERDQLVLYNKGNVIITGHYQSDWIGMNIFLNKLESFGINISRKEK